MGFLNKWHLLFLISCLKFHRNATYEICAPENDSDLACQQLNGMHNFSCLNNIQGANCMLNVQKNVSQIGIISPEEALLGAPFLPDNVVVFGQIKKEFPPPQFVVILRKTINDGFSNLKGKKFCHPGFKHDNIITNIILEELEWKMTESNDTFCLLEEQTLVEKKLKFLANFLGDSCRPGPWTQDLNFDKLLKLKYASLCHLCGPNKCDVDYNMPFDDSLKCLIKNDADIVLTTLFEAQQFFNKSENAANYKYLCKHGSSSPSTSPCIWTNQLHNLLITTKNQVNYMKSLLLENLKNKTATSVLKFEFFPENLYASLKSYVSRFRTIPSISDSKKCNKSMKWCTFSNAEQEKCEWFSQASLNRGIQPVIECIRSVGNNEMACLNDIREDKADLMVASTNFSYTFYTEDLTNLAYSLSSAGNLSTILAVKKSNDSSINTFKDLKNKRACIPEFGSNEFLSFIDVGRSFFNLPIVCDYVRTILDFVGTSCIPGSLTSDDDTYKLCEQCLTTKITPTAMYCNTDEVNKYYGNEGALRCLNDLAGDFAVITKINFQASTNDLRVICRNGSLALENGLNVDENCALATLPISEIVAKQTNIKNADMKLALQEFDRWFSGDLRKPFHLFASFNETKDLLFKDSVMGLTVEVMSKYIGHYKALVENSKCKKQPSSAISIQFNIIIMTSFLVFLSYV